MADEKLSAQSQFAVQWTEPGDIFSVLLLLGADVIQLACAAMGGSPSRLPTPVAFSFGWVAYAFSAVLSALGENRLLRCPPEVEVKVINLKTGYGRTNQSWLLSRFYKTYHFWMPAGVRERIGRHGALASGRGLCVAVYQWKSTLRPAEPVFDWVWWSGYAMSAIQLGVAAVPLGRHGDWAILMITAVGTVLAYTSASLPQWRKEKWHARTTSKKPVALLRGNGTQHVIIVENNPEAGCGYDLEDLAGGPRLQDTTHTVVWTSALAVLWLALLISCTGIKTNTWYLLGVGGPGMLQNMVVAAVPRKPDALGLPVQLVTHDGAGDCVYAEPKVMWALMELESKHEGYGKFLRDDFFPGRLDQWEKDWWDSKDPSERTRLLTEARDKWQRQQAERAEEQERQRNDKAATGGGAALEV